VPAARSPRRRVFHASLIVVAPTSRRHANVGETQERCSLGSKVRASGGDHRIGGGFARQRRRDLRLRNWPAPNERAFDMVRTMVRVARGADTQKNIRAHHAFGQVRALGVAAIPPSRGSYPYCGPLNTTRRVHQSVLALEPRLRSWFRQAMPAAPPPWRPASPSDVFLREREPVDHRRGDRRWRCRAVVWTPDLHALAQLRLDQKQFPGALMSRDRCAEVGSKLR